MERNVPLTIFTPEGFPFPVDLAIVAVAPTTEDLGTGT